MEARIAQGNQETQVHNAVGKIYISQNKDPLHFLNNNQYYDSLEIGQYCEKLDPHLAFTAYKNSNGKCDAELVKVCQDNGLFKDLAHYLVQKQDPELWKSVLKPEGEEETGVAATEGIPFVDIVGTAIGIGLTVESLIKKPKFKPPADHISASFQAGVWFN